MVRTKGLLTCGMVVLFLALVLLPEPALAKTEIQRWHANTGFLGERVNEIVAEYNSSQNDYEVKAVYKGTYPETLTAGIAAYRAKSQPHLLQVFEVGRQYERETKRLLADRRRDHVHHWSPWRNHHGMCTIENDSRSGYRLAREISDHRNRPPGLLR